MTKADISEAARALSRLGASKGGHARAAALSQEELSEQGRAAARARWGKRAKRSRRRSRA